MPDRTVAVAMSGGIDSSVSAALLKKKNYKVIGVTMRIWDEEHSNHGKKKKSRHSCYGPGEIVDLKDAERVANKLDIPFYVFDLREKFKDIVLDYFKREYISGRTPNPCTLCNQAVKFGTLAEKVKESGVKFDYFATGHYARVEYDEKRGRYILKRALNKMKDQSYFLYRLNQAQLSNCLFPVGGISKKKVREKARRLGLEVTDKPESQDFFSGDYTSLLNVEPESGPILNQEGEVLGEHRGIQFYTIGQRRGLGIATGEPLYVIDIRAEKNTIIVGSKDKLFRKELIASSLNWISIHGLNEPMDIKAKIRYRHPAAEARVTPLDGNSVSVRFREPQMAITPGQAVVFYNGDVVVGGGTIERREDNV